MVDRTDEQFTGRERAAAAELRVILDAVHGRATPDEVRTLAGQAAGPRPFDDEYPWRHRHERPTDLGRPAPRPPMALKGDRVRGWLLGAALLTPLTLLVVWSMVLLPGATPLRAAIGVAAAAAVATGILLLHRPTEGIAPAALVPVMAAAWLGVLPAWAVHDVALRAVGSPWNGIAVGIAAAVLMAVLGTGYRRVTRQPTLRDGVSADTTRHLTAAGFAAGAVGTHIVAYLPSDPTTTNLVLHTTAVLLTPLVLVASARLPLRTEETGRLLGQAAVLAAWFTLVALIPSGGF